MFTYVSALKGYGQQESSVQGQSQKTEVLVEKGNLVYRRKWTFIPSRRLNDKRLKHKEPVKTTLADYSENWGEVSYTQIPVTPSQGLVCKP